MGDPTSFVKVWDPIVRYGHWILVIAFFTAYLSEDDFLSIHVWAGYSVGAIVIIRLLWGLVGTRHARFADFVCSPRETLKYVVDLSVGRARRYLGHNPAGGVMVVALLLSLSGTVFSGLVVYAIEEDAGPLARWVAEATMPGLLPTFTSAAYADTDEHEEGDDKHEESAFEEFWEEVHEILANFSLLLVAFHIAGVLFSSHAHKENLIQGMITGRKRSDGD